MNRMAGNSYAFSFGDMTSGKTVTEWSAMQMTAAAPIEIPEWMPTRLLDSVCR